MKVWRIRPWETLFFLLLALSCSKDKEPAPVGCSFTFKGSSFSLLSLGCDGTFSVSAANDELSQELTLINSDTLKSISLVVSPDPESYYSSILVSTPPTITIAGKIWTFSGTIVNGTGDSGAVSGSCTCAN